MNKQFNNLSSASKYSQMQHFGHGNIQQINDKHPLTSSGIKQIIGTNPQVYRNHFGEFFDYSSVQLSTCEMNQHFNKNQLNVSANECSEIEAVEHGMNPQSSANQRAVIDAYDSNSMVKKASSQQHWKGNNSVGNSIGRSNVIYKEYNSIGKACLHPKEVNISPVTENGLETHNQTSASNSSLKENYIPSDETFVQSESSAFSLNNKTNHFHNYYYNKITSRFEVVENKLMENLNLNQFRRSDVGKDL
ncbi:hypothetical protein TNCV_4851381 [Trichonephila clavipes]|nr:hypothetical protein TNCV_4851381 [Trichonephila clavipes]